MTNLFFMTSKGFLDEIRSESAKNTTDIFFKIESLYKSFDEEYGNDQELWIPCFSKSGQAIVPWLAGLPIGEE